jgi:hypothetical protein
MSLLDGPNAEDLASQIPLPLWEKFDPNLSQNGVFEFELDSKALANVLNSLILPSRLAGELHFEICNDLLTARASTKDATFWAKGAVPLLACTNTHTLPASFSCDQSMLARISNLCKGLLTFRLDSEQERLFWQNLDYFSSCKAVLVPCTPKMPAPPTTSVVRIQAKVLKKAISHAATLAQATKSDASCFHGIRVANGAAMGGYFGGASQFSSSELPQTFNAVVPHRDIKNAIAFLNRIPGSADVSVTDGNVHVACEKSGFEGSWSTNGANMPLELSSTFQENLQVRLSVVAEPLQLRLYLFAAFLNEFKLSLQLTDAESAEATITGMFSGYPWKLKFSALIQSWDEQIAKSVGDLQFNMKDFAKAAFALNGPVIEFGLTDRKLFVSSTDNDGSIRKTVIQGSLP